MPTDKEIEAAVEAVHRLRSIAGNNCLDMSLVAVALIAAERVRANDAWARTPITDVNAPLKRPPSGHD